MVMFVDELRHLLNRIVDTYRSCIDNDLKYEIVSSLWTDYYKLSHKLCLDLGYARKIHLMFVI